MDLLTPLHRLAHEVHFLGFLPRKVVLALIIPLIVLAVTDRAIRARR